MIGLYAAYSDTELIPVRVHQSQVKTANQAKKILGLSATAWTYIRLPRHNLDKKCPCLYCSAPRARGMNLWLTKPGWLTGNWTPHPWPWGRYDVQGKNARLALPNDSLIICVDLLHMGRWAEQLYESAGRIGLFLASEWYLSEDRAKLRERVDEWVDAVPA